MATARETIEPYVRDQAAVIATSLPRVVRDDPDAIHATRVATRRLRSALVTFAPLWTRRHKGLRADLRWYASALSRPRDLEVTGEWLAKLCAHPSVRSVPGIDEATATLLERVRRDRSEAMTTLTGELSAARFEQLVVGLALGDWSPLSDAPAELVLVGLATAPAAVVATDVRALPTGAGRPAAVHELRKAAKAARYAVDALGAGAASHAAAWKQVTESLGVAQDAWVAKDVLAELATDEPGHQAVWAALGRLVEQAAGIAEARGLDLVHTATTLPYPRLL